MTTTVYVTLSQFCERDERPRRVLCDAGFHVIENKTARRIRKEEMYEALRDADAVLAAVEPYSAELLKQLPKLKCISRCGAGTDAVDLVAAKKYNKTVLATTDEIVEPVAQMAVGMMLALARNFILHKSDFLGGQWKKHTGFLLSEWTIGLIGFGKIGRAVAKYLRPFGPKILVADPYLSQRDMPEEMTLSSLDELLAKADLVSLHASLPPSAGYLLGEKEFSAMKRGSFFVNTARGYLVDEKSLEKMIQSGHLAGAAMDVFEMEPYSGSLTRYPNVLATPHVATLTHASRAAMELRCAQNVVDFFERLERK